MGDTPNVIEVQNLCKNYREIVAVNNVNFSIKKGEIVGFLGLNGAGKSSTMKVLTGFIPASSGSAQIAGFDVFENPLEVKRRIGYLPEVLPLYPELTVREYLEFVASIKGMRGQVRQQEIARVLEKTNLLDMADRLCGNLSKGYQQRCGIAQALLGTPDVLILDEPTSGLDPLQRVHVLDLIKSLAGEHTIILSTHILQEVEAICPRVVIIHRGHLIADASVSDLISRYQKPGYTPSFVEVFTTMITEQEKAYHTAPVATA